MNNLSYNSRASTYLSFLISALLIGFGYSLFNQSRMPYFDGQDVEVIAEIESIKNSVKVKPTGELIWTDARHGLAIPANTLLFAEKHSVAVISYLDGKKLILMPGSLIEIVTSNKEKFDFKVKKGKVLSVPKTAREKTVVYTEQTEQSKEPLVYIVNTPAQLIIGPGETLTPTVRWDWTSKPREDQELIIKVTGKNYDFHKKLGLRQREESLSLHEAGEYDWSLHLDGELMGGGKIEKKVVSIPLIHFPQGATEVDDGLNIDLGWIYQGDVEKFEVEISFEGQTQIQEVTGDHRKFTIALPRNSPINWRVRAIQSDFKSQWSDSGKFFILSRQQNLMRKLEALLSDLDTEFLVDDLPFNYKMKRLELENFDIKIKGAEKVSAGVYKFNGPGVYTIEVKDLKSSIVLKKKIIIRLKEISDHPEILDGQKVKI